VGCRRRYLLADALELSGIFAVIVSSMVFAHYGELNLEGDSVRFIAFERLKTIDWMRMCMFYVAFQSKTV
jgi:hypothetical protein